ncbi:hypothetical protein AGMMS50276_15590 [Synergistales bacterium]|nr:hypothetical protein AGMMS50276_15590 [Synergistales bacterium]
MESVTVFCALSLLSFAASAISATTGMGGVFLLAGMYALIKDIAIVLPIHACVSMVSNITRIVTYIKFVNVAAYKFFMYGSIFGLAAGTVLLNFLLSRRDELTPYMMVVIGLFIVWGTRKKSAPLTEDAPMSHFALLGLYAAPISLLFGANGVIIAPHLVRKDMSRQVVVATSTACQLSIHVLKIVIFFTLWHVNSGTSTSILFKSWYSFALVLCMVFTALLGTLFGRAFTDRISEKTFKTVFVYTIYIVACKLVILDGLFPIVKRMAF